MRRVETTLGAIDGGELDALALYRTLAGDDWDPRTAVDMAATILPTADLAALDRVVAAARFFATCDILAAGADQTHEHPAGCEECKLADALAALDGKDG